MYLSGKKWASFVRKIKNPLLIYLGEGLFGSDYTEAISKCKFGWGAVSKRFPELHTTRTFEIPACGTALLTEINQETTSFFKNDEAIFYSDLNDLTTKITYYINHEDELEQLIQKGQQRVTKEGFDYESILRKVCRQIAVLN